MRIRTDYPRPVRTVENLWIALPDGCRLAARMWLPEDAEAAPVPAVLDAVPYRKGDGTEARDATRYPYIAGPRLCLRAARPARQRRLRGADRGRVQRAGAGRRRGRDRLARRAAVVRRRGRHDRRLLGRLRGAAGRRAEPAGAARDRRDPLLRRPLRRRRALHRRLRARLRHAPLVGLHDRLHGAAARPRGRGRGLARGVARAAGVDGALGGDLARAPAPRRVLAPGLGLRALRGHRLPGVRGRRLGRRLPRLGAAAGRERASARCAG